jgi:carbon-monoxide dehydrogenase medium subunit
VIPAPFDYTRPSTVDEAVGALAEAGEDAKALAGGQSLLPLLRLRMAAPSLLVDLGWIEELRGVREDGDDLVIGAMTTHAALLSEPLVRTHSSVLAEAVATVADRQVRHLGTIGGSLSHADPAGDLPAAAVAADATMEVAGPSGRRTVAAADFFVDFLTTTLRPDELLVAVRVPKRPDWVGHYLKFNRVAQAWATVGVATSVQRDNGTIAQARVALTNMGPTPVRARAVEGALTGVPATRSAVKSAAMLAGEGTRPTSDVSASAEYRLHLAQVLTARAVAAAAAPAEG